MKKIFSIFLVLLASIGLFACGEKEQVDPDIAIVADAKSALEIGFKEGDTKDAVTQDVTLVTSTESGVNISWSSSKGSVLNQAGRVNRPIEKNEEITLTATLKKGAVTETKEFKVTVLKLEVDPTTPVFSGVQTYVELYEGDEEYDPLEGVTAISEETDVTDSIKTTFKAEWLLKPGLYTFEISAKSATTEAVGKVNVTLVVNAVPVVHLVAPSAVTHYVGSRAFNPLEEVRAFYIDENDKEVAVEVVLTREPEAPNVPGTWYYEVGAENVRGELITQEIKLTTKPRYNVLADLPKGQEIKIELWHSNGTTIENALKSYALLFEAAMQAEGYNIKVAITKNGANYDELKTNTINAGKGGTLPNIIQNYPDHVVEYNANGYIESLAPYMFHPTHGFDPEFAEDSLLDILEGYRIEQRSTNLNGEYISLPFNKSTEVLSYNKDLFDEVLEGEPFPSTWQELFELMPAINRVKDKHIDAIAERWEVIGKPRTPEQIQKAKDEFVPFVYDSSANAFITLVRQFGGSYTSRDENGKGILDFDSPETREMFNYFGGASVDKAFTVPAFWQMSYTNEVSKFGQAVAGIGSTGGLRYNTPQDSGYKLFNLGVAPVPYDAFNPASRTVIQQGTNLSLTKSGTDAQKLASWYFIRFLASNPIQLAFGVETGYSPVRESVYTNPVYLEYLALADTPIADSFTQQLNAEGKPVTVKEYVALYELVVKAMGSRAATLQRQYQFTDTPFIGSSAVRDAVGVAFDRVILLEEGQTLSQAIEAAIAYAIAEGNKGIA